MTVWFLDCWLTPSRSNASERSLLFFQTDFQRMFSAEPLSSVPWGDGLFSYVFSSCKAVCFRDIQLSKVEKVWWQQNAGELWEIGGLSAALHLHSLFLKDICTCQELKLYLWWLENPQLWCLFSKNKTDPNFLSLLTCQRPAENGPPHHRSG